MIFNRKFIKLCFLFFLIFSSYYYFTSYYPKKDQNIASFVKCELAKSFHHNAIWNKTHFKHNPKVFHLLIRFENQQLCPDLKRIDTRNLTYQETMQKFQDKGYTCYRKPLTVSPDPNDKRYLKKDGSVTELVNEKGIAEQQICVSEKKDCVIRIKMDGFPNNIRSQPHSTKAVLLDSKNDPSLFDNEAFKVTYDGKPVPKAPGQDFGLAPCPFKNDEKKCTVWINKIMDVVHPNLKKD